MRPAGSACLAAMFHYEQNNAEHYKNNLFRICYYEISLLPIYTSFAQSVLSRQSEWLWLQRWLKW
jgi:hypothetical protein